ncbi:MAG: DNA-formamidopyrimidine glycosylase [bacterium]|nr:DNA-formamidopyrimidine glycosylase [bacterium]
MPELPEVETVKRGLMRTIINQKILRISVILAKIVEGDESQIIGAEIVSVSRRGKLLIIELNDVSRKPIFLAIHLKMTGQLLFKSKTRPEFGMGHPIPPLNTPVPNKSTKVIFEFESGDFLYFNDLRTFGYIKILNKHELETNSFLMTIGVEPLSDEFSESKFLEITKKFPKLAIKTFLLDQTKIAGLGNIYTDEALFASGIYPLRLVGSLNPNETSALYRAIREVLQHGVETLGSSTSSYVTIDGMLGTFLTHAKVYQRKNLPCLVCGTLISRISFRGRGTHYCVKCQK